MAIREDIVDRVIEYRVFLIRYENRVVRDVLASFVAGEREAIAAIAENYDDFLASGAPRTEWRGRGARTRVQILKRLRASLADVVPEAEFGLRAALTDVADDVQDELEATFTDVLPDQVVDETQLSKVPERQLANIVDEQFGERLPKPFQTAKRNLAAVSQNAIANVDAAVVAGIRDGAGTRSVIAAARRAIGATRGSTLSREVASYVRTSIQATANDVAGQWYRENDDIVRAEQFNATLDDRTCPRCGTQDGKVHRLDGKGRSTFPRPPLHPNCRCFVTPVLHNWRSMGLDGDIPDALKRQLNGKAPDRTTWTDWVNRNPDRLERVLGPGRADLIRNGSVSLQDLVRGREALTLEQIQERMQRRRRAA